MSVLEISFYGVAFLLIYPLIVYPASLLVLDKLYKDVAIEVDNDFNPSVSFIVAAYNEEKVIAQKLNNILMLDYPRDQLEIIVASDGSSDNTNELVEEFISLNPQYDMQLLDVQGRRGKTHAQNEAVKISKGELLVFSDSNSIWRIDALRALVNRFLDAKLGYLSGALKYKNGKESITSESESAYWDFDLRLRLIESKVSSTVGGNGAIYAIRKENYVELPDILSHDGFMPTKMVIQGKTAKFEPNAVAFEKAGETSADEFKRKVRMQRGQPWKKYVDIEKFNVFKYGWFSYFYIGHKYLKYQLYILHPLLFLINFLLAFSSYFYGVIFLFHTFFYILAFWGWLSGSNAKYLYVPYYYSMTIFAQGYAVVSTLIGLSKTAWEKAESTR